MNRMRLVDNDACPAVAWLCFVHDDDRNRCVVDGWGMWMQYGGAIYSYDSTVTLTSCSLSGNAASGSDGPHNQYVRGGSIYMTGSSYSFACTGCYFVSNTASTSGGDVYIGSGSFSCL